jgi:uncharacterized iron-regulated membrane protein
LSVPASFFIEPRKTALRRWFFYVHFYASLIAGMLFAVVGVTGSILVYIPELRVLEVPGRAVVQPIGARLPMDSIYRTIKASRPVDSIESFSSANERDPFELYPLKAWNFRSYSPTHERIQTFIDPYTGRILAQYNYEHRWLQKVYILHEDLLGGPTGRKINAWFAILLVFVSLTGLLLWWRGKRYWYLGFQYRSSAGWKRQMWDLHHLGGFLFSLPLLLLSITGFYYSYVRQFTSSAAALTGGPSTIAVPRSSDPGKPWQPLDNILHNSDLAAPECTPTIFYFPRNAHDSFGIRVDCPYDPHKIGLSHIYVDPSTGRANGVDRYAQAPSGVKIIRLMTPIHYGDVGGTATRILWILAGLMPAVLLVTGILMWWNRSLAPQFRRRRAIR